LAILDTRHSALILLPNGRIVAKTSPHASTRTSDDESPTAWDDPALCQNEYTSLHGFTEAFLLYAYPALLSETPKRFYLMMADRLLLLGEDTEQYRSWMKKTHLQ